MSETEGGVVAPVRTKSDDGEKLTVARVIRLEIDGLYGDSDGKRFKAAKKRWMTISRETQEIVNYIWQRWLVWHIENNSPTKIREYLRVLQAWHQEDKNTRGPKAKSDLLAYPKELGKLLYKGLTEMYHEVHTRIITLILQVECRKIMKRKSAYGNLPGWQSILLCREQIPSSTKLLPIRFDSSNADIIKPATDKDRVRVQVRMTRIDRGSKRGISILDDLLIRTNTRKFRGQLPVMQRLMDGQYKFAGSQLFFDERRLKWFVHLSYMMPAGIDASLEHDRVAYLRPCRDRPWHLRLPEVYPRYPGGRGPEVGFRRRRIIHQRISRQSGYINAGSSNKGHGRRRALKPIWHLSDSWKNFTKSHNNNTTHDVVEQCHEAGCGTLIYFQPAELPTSKARQEYEFLGKQNRFLQSTGQVRGYEKTSGWDWSQVASQLHNKCQALGIKLIVRVGREVRAIDDASTVAPEEAENGDQ